MRPLRPLVPQHAAEVIYLPETACGALTDQLYGRTPYDAAHDSKANVQHCTCNIFAMHAIWGSPVVRVVIQQQQDGRVMRQWPP